MLAKSMLPTLLMYAGPPEPTTAARDPFGRTIGMQAAAFESQGADGEGRGILPSQPKHTFQAPGAAWSC